MEESSERTCSVISGGMNNKMNSDSGYGSHSNKSNSQSQTSSGSSKSHQSSISSGSCNFPKNPIARAPTPCGELTLGPPQALTSAPMFKTRSEKDYKRKKKLKVKSASSTILGENNQRLPATGVEASGASESSASVGNRSLSGGQPSPDGISHIDTKTLQIVALTHTLSCTKKFRDKNLDIDDDSEEEKSSQSRWSEYVDSMKEELSITNENCFGAVVSMDDGLLIHITEELTHLLGYPKDMWMGRNFIDLVHPKDKVAFASQFTFTGGIGFPTGEFCMGQKEPTRNPESFFCRLRQYRGLKTTGFGVVDKTVIFFPFRLTLKLKELEGLNSTKPESSKPSKLEENTENNVTKSVYLFIGANRISSAYQYPEEVIVNPDKFITRHSATCHFGDIDSVAVKYLGHLPQDVVGHSVLDYYHPDDMVLLKDIYEGVMAEHGKPFKSKPYRFRVFNGTFAMLETDWSCFINPWSWKLEFVIGQHKVLKGPLNPNVFMPPKAEHTLAHSSAMHVDEAVGETKMVQEQIKQVLGETVTRRMSEDPLKQRSSRRKKDLAVLLEVLLEQIGSAEETSDHSDSVESEAFSVLERDSAMLGEISPHHDDRSMSNQSSETPPSYNQLNYRENIERFFLSHPKTTRESDEFIDAVKSDGADVPSGSADEESKESPIGSSDCVNRQSGSNSGDNSESSEPMNEETSGCKSCSLTEDVLYRHNENMEKSMAQKHRESRGRNNSLESASHKNSRFRHPEAVLNNRRGAKNNLKRTGYLAGWASTGSSTKAHKQPHMDSQRNFINQTKQLRQERVTPLVNLWPPYSVAITPAVATATYTNTFNTPVTMPRIGIPGYQYLPTVPTVANPQILTERPQQNSFVCFPNQLRQYVPQAVPYTIPGAVLPSASIPGPTSLMYHSLATPPVYRPPQQQLFGQSVAQQQIMIGPGGSSMLPRAPILHPTGPMIPRMPPAGQSLGIGPGVGIGSGGIGGVGTPIPIRPFSAVSHGNIMNPNIMNPNLMTMSAGPRPPATSLSAMIPDCSVSNSNPTSTSSYPSISTTTAPCVSISSSSGIPSTPPIITPKITTSSTSSGEYHIPVKSKANITHLAPIAPRSSSSSSPELSKINKDKMTASTKRIVNLGFSKESLPDYNFSSSDTFGSSSSCSLYSLLKRNIYSDETSTSGSGKAKDFGEFPTFQSNSDADGDQDMIWENHAEKKVKEQGILKSGYRFNGKGKAKLSKPPWLKNVDITREFNFQYQIQPGNLAEILQKDLENLKMMENQTSFVDEQLGQLYRELELEGLASKLNLEEGSSAYSSSSNGGSEDEGDGGADPEKVIFDERQRESHLDFSNKRPIITPSDYDKIVQMFEENAPLPREELLNFSN